MASKEKVAAGGSDSVGKSATEIAREFGAAVLTLSQVEGDVAALRRKLASQAETVAASEEERRRKVEKEDYDLSQARLGQLDQQRRQDAEREAKFSAREVVLANATAEFCELLGIPYDLNGELSRKAIREAYAKRISDTEKAAEGRGRGMAEREAAAAMKLHEATAATSSALLVQENKILRERNAALEQQNAAMLANQQKTTDVIANVAQGAFQAAGGVVKQGNEALGSVVGGQAAAGRRP